MTPRETALMGYFYAVSVDPKMKAAGKSVLKVKDAFLACVAEDVPAVLRHAFGHLVDLAEPVARRVVANATAGSLRGQVPDAIADGLAQTAVAAVGEGFAWLKARADRKRR